MDIFHTKEYFLSLIHGQRLLVPQVVAFIQFIIIIPAKNATSERSFSALLKNYLRTTTLQEHLNYLMLLDVHKKRTDALDMQAVVTEFIGESEHRCGIFAAYNIWAEWQWRRLMYNLTVITVSWVIWVFYYRDIILLLDLLVAIELCICGYLLFERLQNVCLLDE